MGVMGCFRHNCENIMCDRYSPTHGYICNDCFDELVNSGPETNIKEFMLSSPNNANNREAAVARFKVEFPSNYEE